MCQGFTQIIHIAFSKKHYPMMNVNKKDLKEQEIRTMFITPALKEKGWEVLKNMLKPSMPR